MSSNSVQPKNCEFRQRVDALLESLIERFYSEVPYAANLVGGTQVDIDYYKRHTIEIILRLRLKRSIDALTIHYFTKTDPRLAKLWAKYTEDEMLHDTLFAKDLERLGVSNAEIYGKQPLLSTKLLQGYFYYGLEHEGRPLASLCSSYFIEYTSQRTQPQWLDTVAKFYTESNVKGARAHVAHDQDDDHIDFVWQVLSTFITTKADEERAIEHIENVYALFVLFFNELYRREIQKQSNIDSIINSLVA
ncbi:MAG: hypothetical protein K2X93_03765 [Candidatus Obscuribacterales bacterium]|nr:hypothetical protein [Candidatus Obscuribacterales bacterium]